MDVGSGDDSGGETPLPIPNRAVKPTSANGTAPETGWKSRSSPGHEMVSCHLQSKQMAAFFMRPIGRHHWKVTGSGRAGSPVPARQRHPCHSEFRRRRDEESPWRSGDASSPARLAVSPRSLLCRLVNRRVRNRMSGAAKDEKVQALLQLDVSPPATPPAVSPALRSASQQEGITPCKRCDWILCCRQRRREPRTLRLPRRSSHCNRYPGVPSKSGNIPNVHKGGLDAYNFAISSFNS